ncbi:restriction endonuclease subunit S [Helicobacter sp. UBA3407]|uniref:restriction endonuclease subunit S n=1 Tax=Helicobacter sp. UBA3407 TaxID=1946588 RepID=UPI002606649D|nr:restriction endonuclease subunit S [Helicobacter sp. UBA3407]
MINHNLPKNWEVKTLAEVCTSKNSNIVLSSIENNTGKYPIYGAKGLLKTIDFYTIENESLGIVKDGAGVGRIFLLPEKSSLIGTMAYIQANKNLNLKYLYHFLHTINFNQYISGSAIPHIYFRDYKKEKIPLPPLEVQKAIVEKLENAFAHIDEAVHHLKAVQTNIPRLKSSLLHCAFSGKLTESQNSSHEVQTLKSVVGVEGETLPFEPPHPLIKTEIPQGWEIKTLGEVCKINPKNKLDDDLEVSFIPMNLIADKYQNKFSYEIRKWSEVKKGYTHLQNRCIAIAKITPCFENGKCVILQDLKNGYGAGTTELIVVLADENKILPKFVFYFFNTTNFTKEGVKNFKGTAGQLRISKDFITNLQIPLPPLATQNQIVRILEFKFAHLEKLEQFVNESLENLQRLKSSLLNQAFKGELV